MNKNSKLLILGGYGCHNLGDDAQLYNNVRILKEKGYTNLTIMSHGKYIGEACGCKIVPNFRLIFNNKTSNIIEKSKKLYEISKDYKSKKLLLNVKELSLLKNINDSDVLFFSGSGTINTRSILGLYRVLLPCLLAKTLNKKVVLSGQGFMPLDNPKMEEYIKFVLNQVDILTTREFEMGKKELKRIGVKNFILSTDDAFTTPRQKIFVEKKVIAINVSCYIKKNMIKIFHSFANIWKEKGFNPVFVYFHPKDKEIAKKCSIGEFPLQGFNNPKETAYFYSKVVASVGMRYHSTLFALAGGHPTVNIYGNIYQEKKLQGIREETHIPDLAISFEEINIKLYDTLTKAMTSQPEYLKKINIDWRKRANIAIDLMEEKL